ncbi:MAG TPA: UDP-N-acetylmuramate--L-alanine ligase [Acidobacteriota bacterium]
MFRKTRHIHMVGIGGSGMSGIAEVLLNQGYLVSGSDLGAAAAVLHLRALGAQIGRGHSAANIEGADVVVYSSAVRPDNVELVEARRRRVPVIPRAEMLAELMRRHYGIAVAGSHGKTTTTSLVAAVLEAADYDPTIVVGGRVTAMGSSARAGGGEFMVVEADESDGSFLRLTPTWAIVTNVDEEHLDHYGSLAELEETFLRFINKVPFYGAAILCLDHPNLQALIPRVERRLITYGVSSQADFTASDIEIRESSTRFRVRRRGQELGSITLKVPGQHYAHNALAAIALGLELEIPFAVCCEALERFGGVERRFQIKGERGGILVVDDYGHHPTEVLATLAAAKAGWDRRLVVVFQPHRYSRSQRLLDQFARAFYHADVLIVTEIYAAGEEPIAGISGARIAEAIRAHGHRGVGFAAPLDGALALLREQVRPGDLVLTLGAGDVWKVGEGLLTGLEAGAGS